MKRHKFKILSLAAVFALSMALACVSWVFAAAETTYTPSNIFSTSNASTNTDQGYIAYNLSDNANIYYDLSSETIKKTLLKLLSYRDVLPDEPQQRSEGAEGENA